MEHINTLKMYKEYIKSGYTEDQAIIAVESLNNAFDSVVTVDKLNAALQMQLVQFVIIFIALLAIPAVSERVKKLFKWQ